MDPVTLIKNCLKDEKYLEGVAGAVEFLDVKGQGKVELEKTVKRLQQDLFDDKNTEVENDDA